MANTWSQDIYINAYRFAAEAHWNSKKKQIVPGTDSNHHLAARLEKKIEHYF